MSYIFVRKLVLANQRSERWFSHVKKMILPIRIANDVIFTCEKNDMDACTNFDDANLSSRRDDQVGDYVCECW